MPDVSYFSDYVNRPKPNRAERRARQQERERRARKATRAYAREQKTKKVVEDDQEGGE